MFTVVDSLRSPEQLGCRVRVRVRVRVRGQKTNWRCPGLWVYKLWAWRGLRLLVANLHPKALSQCYILSGEAIQDPIE